MHQGAAVSTIARTGSAPGSGLTRTRICDSAANLSPWESRYRERPVANDRPPRRKRSGSLVNEVEESISGISVSQCLTSFFEALARRYQLTLVQCDPEPTVLGRVLLDPVIGRTRISQIRPGNDPGSRRPQEMAILVERRMIRIEGEALLRDLTGALLRSESQGGTDLFEERLRRPPFPVGRWGIELPGGTGFHGPIIPLVGSLFPHPAPRCQAHPGRGRGRLLRSGQSRTDCSPDRWQSGFSAAIPGSPGSSARASRESGKPWPRHSKEFPRQRTE